MGLFSFLGIGKDIKDAAEGIGSLYTTDKDRLKVQQEILHDLAQVDKKQAETNTVNAAQPKISRDWRSLCGYICTFALAMQYIFVPLAQFILSAFHIETKIPTLQTNDLIGLLTGMLGLGALHTFNNFKR